MNCKTFRLRIDELSDGELAGALRRALEQHLAHCSRCRKELDEWKRLNALMRSIPRVEAPENFETALWNRIRSHQETLRSRKGGPILASSWAQAAAALFVFVAAGLLVLNVRDTGWSGLGELRATRTIPGSRPPGTSGGNIPSSTKEATDQQEAERAIAASLRPEDTHEASLPMSRRERAENRPAGLQAPALDYVDFLVRGTEGQEVILRIPSRIKVKDVTNDDEFFYRRVSH